MEYVCEAGVFPQISISMLRTRVNMCTCVCVCVCVCPLVCVGAYCLSMYFVFQDIINIMNVKKKKCTYGMYTISNVLYIITLTSF